MFTKQQIELAERVAKSLGLPFEHVEDAESSGLFISNLDVTPLEDPKAPAFLVSQTSVVPGVRYTSNGDGWPDEVDVIERGTFTTFKEALVFMVQTLAVQLVENTLINLADEEQDRLNLEAAIAAMDFPKLPE